MRIPILATLLLTVLLAPGMAAGDEDALAEILRKLVEIEKRLDRLERKVDEPWPPVSVSVVLDLDSLRVPPRNTRMPPNLVVDARVKLLKAARRVRDLELSMYAPGAESCDSPWLGGYIGGDDDAWAVGTERTIAFRLATSRANYEGLNIRSVLDALAGPRLCLSVDTVRLTDGTVWGDTRDHWQGRLAQLEPGMSFETVSKLLPPADDDVAVQAFPGKPVLRVWRVSPRWMVMAQFGKEGLTGKPSLIPIGPHTRDR